MPSKKATPAATKAASTMKSAPTKPAQATITLKQIGAELAEAQGLTKKQTEALLDGLVAAATSHLKAGAKVRLTGLGILQIQDRPARSGRNPATGAVIQIAASKKIAFRAAKELKDAI